MSLPNTPKTASSDLDSEHTTDISTTSEIPSTEEHSSTPPPAVAASEKQEKVVTFEVIRTVKTVDSTTGDVVDTSSVSQDFDANKDDEDDEDFINDLIKLGWKPRGRNTATSSVKNNPPKPKPK